MSRGGFIYAIGATDTDYVKIGSAKDVTARLRSLQVGHLARLSILATAAVPDAVLLIEKQVHKLLASSRHRGEWFAGPIYATTLERLVAEAQILVGTPPAARRMLAWRSFGKRMKIARIERDMSQKELAARCGFPCQVINRLEQGRQDLYAQRLIVLAEHLGVSTDYLLGRSNDPGILERDAAPASGDEAACGTPLAVSS